MQTTITFAGNLTSDPQLRTTPNGTAIAECRIAVNRRVKDTDNTWSDAPATFHTIKVWGQLAENLIDSATKGARLLVHGLVETETWTDKDTGEQRSKDIVVVSERYGDVGLSLRYTHYDSQANVD